MSKGKSLVVDDEPGARQILVDVLKKEQYSAVTTEDGQEALDALKESAYDLVLTDLNMPRVDGIELLKEVQKMDSGVLSIVLTGCGTVDNAVAAMKAGAFDYITKPYKIDELVLSVKRALQFQALKKENRNLKKLVGKKDRFENFVGDSEEMEQVFSMIQKVADTDTAVMVRGESGTGKELVAQAIHFNSDRAAGPFIPINCGAIPRDLLESELFGHVKGAFTGATVSRPGRFELADGGTLLLDEVGELHPELQVKLLRVLQDQKFERVGGTKTIQVNVRIIAATNKDLEEEIARGTFREDLFYRLNVVPIHIPPLRDRVADIPLLIHHFQERLSREKGRRKKNFSPEVLAFLQNYPWPGNVRELENLVERVTILSEGEEITAADMPAKFTAPVRLNSIQSLEIPAQGISLNDAVEQFENELITKAMTLANGVKSKAARLLSLNRTTLVEKIKKKKLQARFETEL
ncbi:MAG: sigma-54 dependent transcriptional regulator [bacterium]|nr:sigma-54 dependent transcriptional regulator [bacterium]